MRIFFLVFLVSFRFSSSAQDVLRTTSGYEFRVEKKGEGEIVKPGSYVFLKLLLKGENGEVIYSEEKDSEMSNVYLPKDTDIDVQTNPVFDVLSETRVGDVVVLIMPVDSIPNPPEMVIGMKYIEYEMTIKNVTDKAGFDKYFTEKQANIENERIASLKKLPAIKKLVNKTIKRYNKKNQKTKVTPSGLKYYIIKQGTGDNAKDGQTVTVHYYGALKNGTQFDNSYERGQGFSFPLGLGHVIEGWEEGLKLFNKGSKGFLFIPAELGYGAKESPKVPANSELIFYLEMIEIK